MLARRQPGHITLAESSPLRRKINNQRRWCQLTRVLNRRPQRRGHHHHAWPTPIGRVVNGCSSIAGKRPWVYPLDCDHTATATTTNNARLTIGVQQLGKKSNDGVAVHRSVVDMPVHAHLTAGQVHRKNVDIADKRDEILAITLDSEDIVRASLHKTAYPSEFLAVAIDDSKANQIGPVEIIGRCWSQLFARDGNIAAHQDRSLIAVIDTAQARDHTAVMLPRFHDLKRLPLAFSTEEPGVVSQQVLAGARMGEDLDPPSRTEQAVDTADMDKVGQRRHAALNEPARIVAQLSARSNPLNSLIACHVSGRDRMILQQERNAV